MVGDSSLTSNIRADSTFGDFVLGLEGLAILRAWSVRSRHGPIEGGQHRIDHGAPRRGALVAPDHRQRALCRLRLHVRRRGEPEDTRAPQATSGYL